MPKVRMQLTLQFDTYLSRQKFDDLALQLVHNIERDRDIDDFVECVYVATELAPEPTLIRNVVGDVKVGSADGNQITTNDD